MSELPKEDFFLLSLPYSAAPSGGEPHSQLEKWLIEKLSVEDGDVATFDIPNFKIGTLDNLVQQSEELSKLDGQVYGAFHKAGEVLETLYDGNESKIIAAKRLSDNKTIRQYIQSFNWNSSKYRLDKSLSELIDIISKEIFELDSDLRASFNRYTTAKSNLSAADRKQTGNLSVRSLHDIVKPQHFVNDSEYLTTILVAVPKTSKKDFLNSYETLVPYVVPRSAIQIADDSEYILYGVTLFKKYVAEFVSKSREAKWTPRDFTYSPAIVSSLRKEQQEATDTEKKSFAEVIRLSRTAYGDIFKGLIHLKAIRIYVESILRYGLPPNFLINSIYINNSSKSPEKAEQILIEKFGYLGGNAFDKDKKGKVKLDGADLSEYGAIVEADYKPFVFYYLEL